jgi:hypothetical protein
LKDGDVQEPHSKWKPQGSEYDDENVSKFVDQVWARRPPAQNFSDECGMNGPHSFKREEESQIKRPPIEVSEMVEIDDIEVEDADGHSLGHHSNKPGGSPLSKIFSKAETIPESYGTRISS